MNEKTKKQMAKMVDALQPHCDEQIIAAMTCSHAGAMKSALVGGLFGGLGFGKKPSTLPSPVFIAVGPNSIFAFKYSPRGFGYKIKQEVARWPREDVRVEIEKTKMMANFVLTTASDESHNLEVSTIGAEELVDAAQIQWEALSQGLIVNRHVEDGFDHGEEQERPHGGRHHDTVGRIIHRSSLRLEGESAAVDAHGVYWPQ